MRCRSLAFRTDLMVLRLGASEVEDGGNHLVVRSPLNPEFYWGNFLLLAGSAPVEDAPLWLERFRSAFPQAGHVAIGWDRSSLRGTSRLTPLLSAGLELETDQVLVAERLIAPRPAPAGFGVGRVQTEDAWTQLLQLTGACWGVGPSPAFQAARVADFQRLDATGRAAFFGAFQEGQLVASAGIVAGRGGLARFQHVQTHPGFRRRGLAAAILVRAADHARARLRARRLVIVAEREGPAVRLYRGLGFQTVGLQLQLTRPPAAPAAPPG